MSDDPTGGRPTDGRPAAAHRVIRTADGSASVYAEGFGAAYHSTHGALQESQHVFVQAGLAHLARARHEVALLECGFGTGLNYFASAAYALAHGLRLDYTGIEAHPLRASLLAETGYDRLAELAPLAGLTPKLIPAVHAAPWPSDLGVDGLGVLRKRPSAIEELDADAAYDLLYYDAFAPGAQPELWTPTVFARLYRALRPGGVLTTYCVQGQVRRDLRSVGFEVVKLPGPPGKREMTRARRPSP